MSSLSLPSFSTRRRSVLALASVVGSLFACGASGTAGTDGDTFSSKDKESGAKATPFSERNGPGGPASSSGESKPATPQDTVIFGNGSGRPEERGSRATPGVLQAVVRDFRKYDPNDGRTNPDFENVPRYTGRRGEYSEYGPNFGSDADFPNDIVTDRLGEDMKPVYNTNASFEGTQGRTATTHGKAHFDQWYRDTPEVNVARTIPITLTRNAEGVYTYDSASSGVPLSANDGRRQFFPIDDGTPLATPFGNQWFPHNYHFTVEIHTQFKYRGEETFSFSGDDDVFVYINRRLVINIGGIHSRLVRTVRLPELESRLGLVVGQTYPLDFFQAERHIIESNLRIDTTLDLEPVILK